MWRRTWNPSDPKDPGSSKCILLLTGLLDHLCQPEQTYYISENITLAAEEQGWERLLLQRLKLQTALEGLWELKGPIVAQSLSASNRGGTLGNNKWPSRHVTKPSWVRVARWHPDTPVSQVCFQTSGRLWGPQGHLKGRLCTGGKEGLPCHSAYHPNVYKMEMTSVKASPILSASLSKPIMIIAKRVLPAWVLCLCTNVIPWHFPPWNLFFHSAIWCIT